MRNFLLLLIAAVVGAFLYAHFRPIPKIQPRSQAEPQSSAESSLSTNEAPLPPTKEAAILRLSALVDSHINSIFSPLEGATPPTPHHEIRRLRGFLADASFSAPRLEQPIYQNAVQLCDTLLAAIQEREHANLSLADTRAKPYATGLSQNRLKEEEGKRSFFEYSIKRRWAENSKSYRNRVNTLYNYIRAHERKQLVAEP